jgi:hypothetical protein
MNSSLAEQITQRLSMYLAGQSTLSDFHNWLIPAVWDIDHESSTVKRLAYRSQLLLAEFDNGDRTEEDLKDSFLVMLNTRSVTIFSGEAPYVLGSTSTTERPIGELQFAGRPHVMVPA